MKKLSVVFVLALVACQTPQKKRVPTKKQPPAEKQKTADKIPPAEILLEMKNIVHPPREGNESNIELLARINQHRKDVTYLSANVEGLKKSIRESSMDKQALRENLLVHMKRLRPILQSLTLSVIEACETYVTAYTRYQKAIELGEEWQALNKEQYLTHAVMVKRMCQLYRIRAHHQASNASMMLTTARVFQKQSNQVKAYLAKHGK